MESYMEGKPLDQKCLWHQWLELRSKALLIARQTIHMSSASSELRLADRAEKNTTRLPGEILKVLDHVSPFQALSKDQEVPPQWELIHIKQPGQLRLRYFLLLSA